MKWNARDSFWQAASTMPYEQKAKQTKIWDCQWFESDIG